MNVVKEIQRINERELESGLAGTSASWHEAYSASAWVFVGGLAYALSEGDVLCMFSQWGEVEDLHLVRDEDTGKSKGFAFIKYADQRSTVLAVDNFNGIDVLGHTLRVDHKLSYQPPVKKRDEDGERGGGSADDDEALAVRTHTPGHAYEGQELANEFSLHRGVDVFAPAATSDTRRAAAKHKHKHKSKSKHKHKSKHKSKHKHKHKSKRSRTDDASGAAEAEASAGGRSGAKKRRSGTDEAPHGGTDASASTPASAAPSQPYDWRGKAAAAPGRQLGGGSRELDGGSRRRSSTDPASRSSRVRGDQG